MGAVYKLTFRYLSPEELVMGKARLVALDMGGRVSLRDYVPSAEAEIFILGSEAHGIDEALLRAAQQSIRIDMAGKMESLNLAVSAALLCYQLSMQER
jgi:tRNA G18 (ribose-2'-O)-methylase SpoU